MARTAHSARKLSDTPTAGKRPIKEPLPRSTKSLSVRTPLIGQDEKPKKSARERLSKNVAREIRYYQNNVGFLVPKAGIVKMIRQLMNDVVKSVPSEGVRFTVNALGVLHEAMENHLVCLLELAYMAARHAKRVTLFATDLRLINRIKRSV